jgi:hypothetical protein
MDKVNARFLPSFKEKEIPRIINSELSDRGPSPCPSIVPPSKW